MESQPPTSTDQVAQSIRNAVASRRLRPGARLQEQNLADIYGVSRTIVRQALQRLQGERLVALEPSRGASIAVPTVAEAREVFSARRLIETAILRQLCATITQSQIDVLREQIDAERGLGLDCNCGSAGHNDMLADFHLVLAGFVGNSVLLGVVRDLTTRSSLITLLYQPARSAQHSSIEHTQIVRALESKNAELAATLMDQHLIQVESNLQFDHALSDLGAALQPVARRGESGESK